MINGLYTYTHVTTIWKEIVNKMDRQKINDRQINSAFNKCTYTCTYVHVHLSHALYYIWKLQCKEYGMKQAYNME